LNVRWLANLPLTRQLMLLILVTCAVVLLLACGALAIYESLDFRRAMVRDMTVLGEILGENAQAALTFEDEDAAKGILASLKADAYVQAARIFDRSGTPFADYARTGLVVAIPERPGDVGHRFAADHLDLFQPITRDGKLLGTIYLRVSLQGLSTRLALFAAVSAAVLLCSFLLAWGLSARLQRVVSRPIVELAGIAQVVAERKDYTVRAPAVQGRSELGRLTAAFNHMLAQIHDQSQALRHGEERVRAVVDSALSAVVVIDQAGCVLDWNTRAEGMFGWSRGEVAGRDLIGTIIPEAHRDQHRGCLRELATAGAQGAAAYHSEMHAQRRDGVEFPAELSISVLRSEAVLTFCCFITDITERRRMEEMRVRLASIVQSSEDAILSKTIGGTITSWNPGAQKLFGFTAEEAVGKPMRLIIPDDRLDEESRNLARISRGEIVEHFETTRRRKDGVLIDVSVTISPIKEPGGRVVGASSIARDITGQKRAETRIQAQLTRLGLLSRITRAIGERQDLESIFQVVIRSLEDDLPIDFGCVCLRDLATGELVFSSVGVCGEPLASVLASAGASTLIAAPNGLERCLSGELIYAPDLRRLPMALARDLAAAGLCALVAAPLLVESKVFGIVMVARKAVEGFSSAECEFLRQLSEHVALAAHQTQLHGALQQAYDDLRQTQQGVMQQERLRVLGQMSSGIAHDINNAISPVMLYTEALLEREPNLSQRSREYLETIKRAIEDVAHTVARMREFYRQREPQSSLTPVDLNEMVKQVEDLTRARWSDMPQQRGIVIEMRRELADGLPAIHGIPSEIREALINLVFNAVDAMPEGGRLTLRTRMITEPSTMPRACVEVEDTGLGMDEDTRKRCLEPFFTTKGERGTGLGLAMVYGVMQRHGADIEIDSAVGTGTTMSLVFPVPPPVTSSQHVAVPQAPLPPMRILTIDDDPLILRSLRAALEGDGHRVITANQGQAGVDAFVQAKAAGDPFAVVITDLGMPHVDGRKVASLVKAASPGTPVIMLTGWGQRLIAEGDTPPHVDLVLSKPPKLAELRAAIARCCGISPRLP
jgi:PAS domain S-box-containing protein